MNKYDIFISYRRDGGYETAKHINDLLVRDGYRVSFDIDTLRSGSFDTQLLDRIDQCKDFLLIVDQHAFDRTLDLKFDPKNDWLRNELAYALKNNKNIVPLFLAGVNGFPTHLPADIAGVVLKNGCSYSHEYFDAVYSKIKNQFLISKPKKRFKGWLFFLLAAIVVLLSLLFIFNKNNTTDASPIIEKEVSIESGERVNESDYDPLDIRNLISTYIDANVEGSTYWSVFAKNDYLTPKSFDVELTDKYAAESFYCSKLEYSAKLKYKGDPVVENDAGQNAIAVITLLGPNSGPMLLKIEFTSGAGSDIIDNAKNIAYDLGFEYLRSSSAYDNSFHSYLYQKQIDSFPCPMYYLITVSEGSGGYFMTIYVSYDEGGIDHFVLVD